MIKSQEIADPQSCLNRAADDEPVFVLRAKDPLAPTAIIEWAESASNQGLHADKIREALACADAMQQWREKNVEYAAAPSKSLHTPNQLMQFFSCEHLREGLLRETSQTFAELAKRVDSVSWAAAGSLARDIGDFIRAYDNGSPANIEATTACTKLVAAREALAKAAGLPVDYDAKFSREAVLRLILEAKDCAVRALLYRHTPATA